MDKKEKSFLDRITSPLTGDYRKKKPISVKAADVAVDMTPIGSAVEIGEELSKEDPSYGKVAIIAAGDALGAAIPAMGPVAKSLIKQSDKIADLKDVPTVEAAGLTDEAIEAWRKKYETPEEFRKALKGRNEELQELAAGIDEGRVFTSTYRKRADELRPIRVVEEVPKPATFVEAVSALNAGKRKKPMIGLNASIPDGDEVTARLDIDAYTDYDVWVPTLTHPELKTVYKPAVVLEDVKFIQPEGREVGKALKVAKGEGKKPFAVMKGKYVEATDDEAYKLAQEVFDNPEFTQVGYDPTRRGFFYDRETGEAILSADTVIQVGHLVLARNAKKVDAEAFPFNEGGIAMEEQMAMNFGDVPDNTIGQDPVSGNDIPLGASAENVRDDIPANLSEGEIVVPADVVNFHGVKLFEDLRAEAKMGYAQMADDGRMGGEPMEMDEDDIGLEFADLEIMIMPDEDMEEEPVEMYRGGRSMRDYQTPAAKKSFAQAAKRNPSRNAQQTHDQIMASFRRDDDRPSRPSYTPAAISARVQARAEKPKNRFEAIQQQFAKLFRDDDSASEARAKRLERVRLESKPPTSDDAEGPSIAEQINFGGDYDKEYEVTPRREKRKKAPTIQEDRARQQEEQETYSVRYADKSFAERFMEGLGFDEGGMVEEPFYDQKGGFGELDYSGIQAREYMNDQGQKIVIMFQDGVPLTPIPEGYYPVAATVTPDVDSSYNVDTVRAMTGGGSYGGAAAPASSGRRDDPGGGDQSIRLNQASDLTPVNYKELSLEELRNMLEDQGSIKQKGILAAASAINPIMALAVRAAMWDTSRKTKAEIERRLGSGDTTEVDKMRYTNMLEIAEREKPSLLDRLTGKAFEKEYSQIPSPDIPAVDFSDPTLAPDQGIAEPYTPEVTTPVVADPAATTTTPFVSQSADADAFDKMQDQFDIERIEADMKARPRPVPKTATTPIVQASPRVQQARKGTQEVLQNMRDRGASREERTQALKAGARTENVLRDLDRGVQRGFEKGGLASKKKARKKKSK